MEGLIKGLINVALGGNEEEDRRERRDETNYQDRDERSRSTWAEVASGHQENDGFNSGNNAHEYQSQEKRHGRNDAWESNEQPPMRRPQIAVHQGYVQENEYKRDDHYEASGKNKEEEQSNDGWETVQKKPSKGRRKVHMDQWNDYKRAPEDQTYSDDITQNTNMDPSHEELSDLSKACNKLCELDFNRLTPGRDYRIDVGEGKKVYQQGDMAEGCLFSWVNEDIFRRPTISRFCSLLDNYNPHEGYKEVVTSEEKQEQAAFLEEISRTAPIKYLYKYLSSKGTVSGSFQEFKAMMSTLWFDLYNRGGACGSSSAFEHVFVGEIKQDQEVSGFHNWLQFYLEEAKGAVDYQGFILPRRRGQFPDSETQVLTVQFEWNGVLKSVSSTLIGVSPEFEIALYTLCFFYGGEDNHIELGPYPVNIKCYRFGNKIGSAFPIAET